MNDLVAFLSARLDDDERLASEARAGFFSPECLAVFASSGDGAHVARHDPARVLREVAAARDDLAEYAEFEAETDPEDDAFHKGELLAFRRVIKRRAFVYADHPDYRQEWKP